MFGRDISPRVREFVSKYVLVCTYYLPLYLLTSFFLPGIAQVRLNIMHHLLLYISQDTGFIYFNIDPVHLFLGKKYES